MGSLGYQGVQGHPGTASLGGCIAGELQGEMLSGRTMFILYTVRGDKGVAKRLHPGPSENVT